MKKFSNKNIKPKVKKVVMNLLYKSGNIKEFLRRRVNYRKNNSNDRTKFGLIKESIKFHAFSREEDKFEKVRKNIRE